MSPHQSFIMNRRLVKSFLFIHADVYDLTVVMHEVLKSDVVHNWKALGMCLGLNEHLICAIEADCKDSERCLRKLLELWLKYGTRFGQPSWKLLVAAVANPAGGNDHALAERIATKHNGKYKPAYCRGT